MNMSNVFSWVEVTLVKKQKHMTHVILKLKP